MSRNIEFTKTIRGHEVMPNNDDAAGDFNSPLPEQDADDIASAREALQSSERISLAEMREELDDDDTSVLTGD